MQRITADATEETMKRIDDIGFGGLRLVQDSDGFCYGTDAILLAHMLWRDKSIEGSLERIVDLGTGNGVVPLILSAKTRASIVGVEVQPAAAELAEETIKLNRIEDRVEIINGNVRDIKEMLPAAEADAVTANPPYTEAGRGIVSSNAAKAIARQEIEGTLADFLEAAEYILKPGGHLYMVHRPARLTDLIEKMRALKLEPKEIQMFSGKRGEPPNILLLHAVKGGKNELRVLPELAVRNDDGSLTEEIKAAYV